MGCERGKAQSLSGKLWTDTEGAGKCSEREEATTSGIYDWNNICAPPDADGTGKKQTPQAY